MSNQQHKGDKMKKLTILLITLFVISIVLLGVIPSIVSIYNNGIYLKNEVSKSKSNVDICFNKQYMLVDNLVEIVKKYSIFEASTLEKTIGARYHNVGSGGDTKSIIGNILVVQEKYPELKTHDQFTKLTNTIVSLETEIQQCKMTFNESAVKYNSYVAYFPNSLIFRGNKWNAVKLYESSDKKLIETKDTKRDIKM